MQRFQAYKFELQPNRSILDQGWGEFRRQLEYKVAWRGGVLLAVPPHNTSRTCPCCGHIAKERRPRFSLSRDFA